MNTEAGNAHESGASGQIDQNQQNDLEAMLAAARPGTRSAIARQNGKTVPGSGLA